MRVSALLVTSLLLAQAESPEALYVRGVDDYDAGRYEEAVSSLERAAAMRSDVPDYRFHLGLAYLKTGKPREAARELEAALGMVGLRRETRLKEPLILVQAAIAYLHLGNIRTARMRAELAKKKSEPDADIEYILGLVAREEGDEAEALARFSAAVELDRDHREANLALASILAREGRSEDALAALRHATHREDGTYEIYMTLGELSYQTGDVEGAGAAFAFALEARPGDPMARYNLGTVRLAEQRYSEAIELFDALEEPRARFHLGEAYRASGAFEEATKVLSALIAQDGDDNVEARLSLALSFEGLGDTDAAERAYREILAAHPDEPRALLNLAVLVESDGRASEALPLLERALAVVTDETAREQIEQALASLKR